MRRDHWMSFTTIEELERHLRDNLSEAAHESGQARAILSVYRQRQRIQDIELNRAAVNPGLTAMFEAELAKRQA